METKTEKVCFIANIVLIALNYICMEGFICYYLFKANINLKMQLLFLPVLGLYLIKHFLISWKIQRGHWELQATIWMTSFVICFLLFNIFRIESLDAWTGGTLTVGMGMLYVLMLLLWDEKVSKYGLSKFQRDEA